MTPLPSTHAHRHTYTNTNTLSHTPTHDCPHSLHSWGNDICSYIPAPFLHSKRFALSPRPTRPLNIAHTTCYPQLHTFIHTIAPQFSPRTNNKFKQNFYTTQKKNKVKYEIKKKEKENFFVGKATLYGCFAVESYNHLKSGLSYILSSSPPLPITTTTIVFAVGRIPS